MPDHPLSKTWCQQALAGDRAAAEALVQHHHQPLYAYLRRLCGNEADACDLTQQTFSKAWQSLDLFRGASGVSTWLHRIAYCTYVDWVRRQRPTGTMPDGWWETLPAGEPSPLEALAEADLARRLYTLVEQLDPECRRAAVHLHYYQHLTLAETAEVLALPLSTLKHHLRSAVDDLRRQLAAPAQAAEPFST